MNQFPKLLTFPAFILVGCLMLLCQGCSDSGRQQQLDQIERVVRQGLEAWQAGNKPESLNSGDNPLEFVDEDWQRGAKLTGFEILKTYFDSSGDPRCFVRLKIQAANKPASEVECNYKIRTEPTVMVARDPMG